MVTTRRRLVRRIFTQSGERVVYQVPHDQEALPGWQRYELLAHGPDAGQCLRLTLYERVERGAGGSDPRAA